MGSINDVGVPGQPATNLTAWQAAVRDVLGGSDVPVAARPQPYATFNSGSTTTTLGANTWARVNPGTLTLTGGVTWNPAALGFVLPSAGLWLITTRATITPSAAAKFDTGISTPTLLPSVHIGSQYLGQSDYRPNEAWLYAAAAGDTIGLAQRCGVAGTTNFNVMTVTRLGPIGA